MATILCDTPATGARCHSRLETCPRCRRPRQQLFDGVCLACKQAAHRNRPRRGKARVRRACSVCGTPLTGRQESYCSSRCCDKAHGAVRRRTREVLGYGKLLLDR